MSKATSLLEKLLGVTQFENMDHLPPIRGILQTKNYEDFLILSDTGDKLLEFNGAKKANKCLPGDHIYWDDSKCMLELRDEHPLIIGTIELTNKSKYGLTSRKIPMYLFTPYDKKYPHFIVGCSEKDTKRNKIGLVKFDNWSDQSTFPRGLLQQTIGLSGDFIAEKQALIWQACPWKYPIYSYEAKQHNSKSRLLLSGFTFHIDPKGCKDVDDVFTIKYLDNKTWKITITISDVASFIEDGDSIDIMASLIGQTLYDKNGKVLRPMLPEEYSEKKCSLLPGKESYGVSLQFIWNGVEISNKVWFESKLITDQSYTYEEFMEEKNEYRDVLKEITSYMAKDELNDSHQWVEQMMIYYNKEAGILLKNNNVGILRRHSQPNKNKLEKYSKYIKEWRWLAYSSAEYCLAEEENTEHYGLETSMYAHASSPIRRYADLVNQRIIKQLIHSGNTTCIVPQAMYDMNMIEKRIRQFDKNMEFLEAIESGKKVYRGIIMEKMKKEDNMVKIKVYLPEWKRMISTTYKYLSEDKVLSRDEKTELDVSDFKEVQVEYAFNLQLRNWKDRVIIHLSN
jgi:exoribonuclease R